LAEQEIPQKKSALKRWLLLALPLVAIATYFAIRPGSKAEVDIASSPVEQGEFVISLELKGGELEAIKAENIVAPRVRGQLKITELFPEGETVEVGDLLVQFEPSEFQKRLMDDEQQLEQARAELEKTRATQKADISGLEGAIENQEANMRLAELQVERMAFEATVEKERAQIEARKATLSYQQAVEKLESQKIVNATETKKRELNIDRQQRDLDRTKKEIEDITIKAEKPGLVVYGKVWKGSGPEKIRVGDEIWGGVNIISLPDLSRMQVKTYVNEVDVDKLKVGQTTTVKLDALPEPIFHGKIATIASLGREKEGEKNVKVFDVTVEIDEEDERLKPGMTATADVIIETIPPRPQAVTDSVQAEVKDEVIAESAPMPLYIPLDAVFEKDGRTVVYRLVDGQPTEAVVALGKRNEDYVVIESGLTPGDRVTLRDPTLAGDDISGTTSSASGDSAPKAP
jgi:multidrug resistance efflux pump